MPTWREMSAPAVTSIIMTAALAIKTVRLGIQCERGHAGREVFAAVDTGMKTPNLGAWSIVAGHAGRNVGALK
jgi:hypothetical protein